MQQQRNYNYIVDVLPHMKKAFFFILLLTFSFCNRPPTAEYTASKKQLADSLVYQYQYTDSLPYLINNFKKNGNKYGLMVAYRQLGKRHRDNTRFSEAINAHLESLQYALELKDTLEVVQAYNNLGTNFRRIGALSEASEYHFQALDLSKNFAGSTDTKEIKSHVVTLNGIGNVSLTLGYYDDALKYFREALGDEIKLESHIGQAINYANIGSIFEKRDELDSAKHYYQLSLEHNIAGKSDMGIGLCYTHFGDIYKKEKRYDLAQKEYQKAYDLMENISDRWHWLEACLSIADIHLVNGEYDDFKKYIALAEKTAHEINSPGHMSIIYRLKHEYDILNNNFASALKNFKQSITMNDSVQGIKKNNQYLDLRVNYEQKKYSRTLQEVQAKSDEEQRQKQNILYLLLLVSVSGIVITGVLYYAYRQRTKSNDALRMMEKTRTDFFTGITHEFRTPLTVIMGMAESIKAQNPNSMEAQNITLQSDILLLMVNQLLDMAKLKSRHEKTKWVHGDSVVLLQMNIESFQDYASNKGVDLQFQHNETNILIDFIPDYFVKIIRNLLSNALKHTPRGGIVTVNLEKTPKHLSIKVSDTGKGIDPEDMPYIFDEFYMGKRQYHNESGSGVGLTLVKNMIEIMSGTVSVRNNQVGGAEFTIEMPLKQAFEVTENWRKDSTIIRPDSDIIIYPDDVEENDVNIAINPEQNNNTDKSCLLIIEDNASIQRYIGSLLENDYYIRYASNGEDGLQRAKDFIPDLIITDLMMPVMDGIELTKQIRSNEILNHLPIIVITAKTFDEDKHDAFNAGADAVLHKPFNPSELKIRVEKLLEQRRSLREKYSQALIEGTPEDVDLTRDDREFLNRVINIIYERIDDPNLNADSIADKVFMSRSQLNRKVKQISDYSISAFILHIRLEKAKRMLRTDNTRIGDIAITCGFDDSNYFSRVFKQVYHVSPSQFRKNPTLN